MQPVPVSLLQPVNHPRTRTALVASADRSFRQRLTEILTGLRWQVREAEGGAQAWSEAETSTPEAIIVDSWLPDLDLGEFLADFRGRFPHVDVVSTAGQTEQESPRGPFRQELLYALRRSQDTDTAAWNLAPVLKGNPQPAALPAPWPVVAAGPAEAGALAAPSGPKQVPWAQPVLRLGHPRSSRFRSPGETIAWQEPGGRFDLFVRTNLESSARLTWPTFFCGITPMGG